MSNRAYWGMVLVVAAGLGACSDDDASSSETTTTTATGSGGMTGGAGGGATTCGDGVVEGTEECEPGGSEACTDDCQLQFQPGWSRELPDMRLRALAVDDQGRVYAAGNSIDGFNENPTVTQYAADGTPGWTYTIDTDSTDEEFVADIAVHPSGDLVLTGIRHADEFAFSEVAYVARLDVATGAAVWTRQVPKTYATSVATRPKIAVDAAGHIVVAVAETGQGNQVAAVFGEWDADGNLIRNNARPDTVTLVGSVAGGAAGDFEALVSLATLADPNNPDHYRIRPDAQGDFTQDTLIDGGPLRGIAIGLEGDRWLLRGQLRRTDMADSEIWSTPLTAFFGLDLTVRNDGSSYVVGDVGIDTTEIRAVSAQGDIVWTAPTERVARAVSAGGRTLAVVGSDLDADSAFIETTRIPAVP